METSTGSPHASAESGALFSERLWPGLQSLLFAQLILGSVGIAYAHAYTLQNGILIWLALSTCAGWLAVINSPKVEVASGYLKAGKARLPINFVGEPKVLNCEQTKSAVKSPGKFPGYLLVRPSIRDSVVIANLDTQDPHPYWQISTRKADALVAALQKVKQNSKTAD